MSEHGKPEPATEARGGEHPDWENARPGEPLREKPDLKQAGDDEESEPPPGWASGDWWF